MSASTRIIVGDARTALAALPDALVQCCVTSPPYFGLRDYGIDGQIGLEPTVDAYVAELVAVFREVRRVLRDDGVLWLNLGDAFAGSWGNQGRKAERGTQRPINGPMMTPVHNGCYADRGSRTGAIPEGATYKPKDLLMVPARVALALQADGWWLRSEIVWNKPNPMPESVGDRPTSAHEKVWLLAKSASYFYDAAAIAEPAAFQVDAEAKVSNAYSEGSGRADGGKHRSGGFVTGGTRNARNVWTISTQPSGIAHYAMMPPELAERCIKAGTSERGQCPACGAPWQRVVQKPDFAEQPKRQANKHAHYRNGDRTSAGQAWQDWRNANPDVLLGWEATCACPAHQPVPQTVLDPFGGGGTTALVANRLGRSAVLVELSPAYADIARNRIVDDAPLFAAVAAE